ncbi:MAG: hypothetical protein GTO22_00840 [Gemmatimonadales bacterium]|nr:hypothetical protein [Gemmatimonadales bacterium]
MARAQLDQATFAPSQFQSRRIVEIYGFDSGGSVWRRVAVNAAGELIIGGGGGVGITDTDDNDVAAGQTTLLTIDENYIHDGTAWIRLQGGVDNAAAPASPQGAFVGGIVTDPVDAFVDGDVSLMHFDTSGRLLVSAIEGVSDDDDNSIALGQNTGLEIVENYIATGADWIRWQGGVDNAAAVGSPQGAFVGGIVTDPVGTYANGDVSLLHFNTAGELLVSQSGGLLSAFAPFEFINSQATIAASGSFTATVQQNSASAGSGGRTELHGFVHYGGAASDLTVTVEISLDGGGTFVLIDTFTVTSGTPTVVRDLDVALGNRVRVTVTNNDAGSGTGTTNIGFYLTIQG